LIKNLKLLSVRNISIRNKLVFMQVFTSVIVLVIFFIGFIISDIRDYKERKVNSVASLAHVIGTNAVSAIQFLDNSVATANLAELKDISPEVIYANITDKSGKIFASYTRPGAAATGLRRLADGQKSIFSGKQLYVSDDIINNNELTGKVLLVLELTELEAIKKSRYEMAALLLVIAVFFSFLIALMVQPYISRRLLYLVNAMKNVRQTGNYKIPIADDGKDEISTLTQAFNQLMEQVQESQQRKDEFIGIASHELKTPLTSIKGYLDLLNTMETNPTNRLCVQKALESAHKLENLIKDLLDVSRIQSGQLQLNVQEFNIGELVDETIASFQMVSLTHTIEKENSCNGQIIAADRQRIEQVLINLLSNAIKYSPGKNRVNVRCEKKEDELIIQVRDYGIGIAEDELHKIFERFYRTKDSSVHISGFGLGLYICNDILVRHRGRIWVQREQEGSSFYFSLPLNVKGYPVEPNHKN
jgi:signal transduction histidine kinase